jgi:hypothetical protein
MRALIFFSSVVAMAGCGTPFGDGSTGSGGAKATSSATGDVTSSATSAATSTATSSATTGAGGSSTSSSSQSSSQSSSGAGGAPCDGNHKLCAGQCVGVHDPAFGCSPVGCAPCSIPNATAQCSMGKCAMATCDLGWNDCDGMAANGCEVQAPCAVVSPANAIKVGDSACLAVDATDVYYTTSQNPGNVMKVPKAGGVPVAIVTNQAGPAGIALGGGFVFWTTPSTTTINRSDLDGSNYKSLNSVNGVKPQPITADAANVYWTDITSGDVWQMDFNGGSVVHISLGEGAPRGITVDATTVYWTNAMTGDVRMAAKGSSMSASTLVSGGMAGTNGVAVSPTAVYWTASAGMAPGAILTNPIGSPTAMGGAVFAPGQPSPWAIAIDATALYWSDLVLNGTILKQPLAGGAAVPLALNQPFPINIAVDATSVYWIAGGAGTIFKTTK